MKHCLVTFVTFLFVVPVQKFMLLLHLYKQIKVNNICLKFSFDSSYMMFFYVSLNSQQTAE
jgi:hypothetical protein